MRAPIPSKNTSNAASPNVSLRSWPARADHISGKSRTEKQMSASMCRAASSAPSASTPTISSTSRKTPRNAAQVLSSDRSSGKAQADAHREDSAHTRRPTSYSMFVTVRLIDSMLYAATRVSYSTPSL